MCIYANAIWKNLTRFQYSSIFSPISKLLNYDTIFTYRHTGLYAKFFARVIKLGSAHGYANDLLLSNIDVEKGYWNDPHLSLHASIHLFFRNFIFAAPPTS